MLKKGKDICLDKSLGQQKTPTCRPYPQELKSILRVKHVNGQNSVSIPANHERFRHRMEKTKINSLKKKTLGGKVHEPGPTFYPNSTRVRT